MFCLMLVGWFLVVVSLLVLAFLVCLFFFSLGFASKDERDE